MHCEILNTSRRMMLLVAISACGMLPLKAQPEICMIIRTVHYGITGYVCHTVTHGALPVRMRSACV